MTDTDGKKAPGQRAETAATEPEDDARRIILARRARFVAAALASAGIATASCGGETSDGGSPEPCLSIGASGGHYNDAGSGGQQTGTGGLPTPCLSLPAAGGMPMPCLSPPQGGAGGAPQPCLEIAPTGGAGGVTHDAGPDATDAGPAPIDAAVPVPCLSLPAPLPEGDDNGESS